MRTVITVLVFSTCLAGCKSYDPQRVEEDFGESMRQMIKEQTYTPESVPASFGPDRLDGPTAVETIENYKATVKKGVANGGSTGSGETP